MDCRILDNWDEYLEFIPNENKDIYFEERYVRLYENINSKVCCLICEEDDRIMLMPIVYSRIEDYYDFETPYGYGGPITNCYDRSWIERAFKELICFLKEENYICGFIRFHPLLQNRPDVAAPLFDRFTISIDSSMSPDDIWRTQISSKNRNMIRKAEKNGLEYKTEDDLASLDEFIALYDETMKRLGADDFYFFDNRYYRQLKAELKGNTFLGTVRLKGKMICAALFLYSECYGHYHLQGNDRENSSLGASNYLLWNATCHMHELGIKEFHLGGGTTSLEDDSLFKFKRAFSSNLKQFYIGKEIFDTEKYREICEKWKIENPKSATQYDRYLLKYRYTDER